jgi:tRNA pseudouridine13 synthase
VSVDSNVPADSLALQARAYSLVESPRAWGGPAGHGLLRVDPEDFFVEEIPGFEPDGEGEHLLLLVEKRELNTADVANALRRLCGVRQVDVSYAGLKDRYAVSRQWFSVYLPGKADPPLPDIESDRLRVLKAVRHSRKLRRGALRGNRFRLVVREFSGDADRVDEIFAAIARDGFPNYFGAQRFGRNNSNLVTAAELFHGKRRVRRAQKGFPFSAVRSMLFNRVLASRITGGHWNQPLEGEVFQLAGARGLFRETVLDDELLRRCADLEISPTGPLWGRDARVQPLGAARDAEYRALAEYMPWCEALEKEGLEGDRRPLRATAAELRWAFRSDQIEMEFVLGRGSYATALVREALADRPGVAMVADGD